MSTPDLGSLLRDLTRYDFAITTRSSDGPTETTHNEFFKASDVESALAARPAAPVCATCQGRGWIMRSETGGDSSRDVGWGKAWNEPCPDCARPAAPRTPELNSEEVMPPEINAKADKLGDVSIVRPDFSRPTRPAACLPVNGGVTHPSTNTSTARATGDLARRLRQVVIDWREAAKFLRGTPYKSEAKRLCICADQLWDLLREDAAAVEDR